MSLKEDLEASIDQLSRPNCSAAALLESLEPGLREDAERLLNLSPSRFTSVMRANGYRIGERQATAHARGTCPCQRS